MELREPKRKRRVQLKVQQPFPVPIQCFTEDVTFNGVWRIFTGQYGGDNVVVFDPESMTVLNKMGFFGKGSLSRSAPTFGKWKMDAPPLVFNRQWKRRCEWARLSNVKTENGSNSSMPDTNSTVKNRIKKESDEDDDIVIDSVGKSGTETDKKQGQTVIVLADSDCDSGDEDYLLNLHPRLEQEEFPIHETLHLTLEEAFFLSYGLGCLQVRDLQGFELSLLELWKLFCQSQPDFVEKYVAYHYFRSKGWVVKPGIKFGGDFLLYKQGPIFYHASYIVHVHVVGENGLYESHNTPISWTQYMGLNRLAETAGKEILLCNVVWPPTIPRLGPIKSPKELEKFTVHEVLMRRWVPSEEREEQEDDLE